MALGRWVPGPHPCQNFTVWWARELCQQALFLEWLLGWCYLGHVGLGSVGKEANDFVPVGIGHDDWPHVCMWSGSFVAGRTSKVVSRHQVGVGVHPP